MFRLFVAAALCVALPGCGDSTGAGEFSRVLLFPPARSVARGDSMQLVAQAVDARDKPIDAGPITWTSLDTLIATVSETGMLRGVAAGEVRVQAEVKGRTGVLLFTVLSTDPIGTVILDNQCPVDVTRGPVTLTAVLIDQNGYLATSRPLTWTLTDHGVAELVHMNGLSADVQLVSQPAIANDTVTVSVEGQATSCGITWSAE